MVTTQTNPTTGGQTTRTTTQELIHVRDDEGTHMANMGWIADRLPTLAFNQGTYTLTITDAHTGKQHTRSYDSYDSYGKPTSATDDTGAQVAQLATLDDFHQNIQQTFINAALAKWGDV